ncbi:MAG: Rieske 2Fe-2S domain-containing protein [Actinobacteria bacterium]|nr:Rieske 2Fe-2S domain-containing protein [Actinomycetota bacterium]MBV8563280.1 Rieske 2Fe-2S domain-containing protein [Actinomycetota bacterium]
MTIRYSKQLADLAEPLDAVADPVQEAVKAVPKPVRDVLDGVWLGNPLHPALTDVPLGAWTAAAALDLVGSEAADQALLVGILGAVPAALTGLNDWSHLQGDSKRVGVVHGLLNTMGLTLNVASFLARRDGRRGLAKVLSGVAYIGALFSAHLGGQLSYGFGVRVNRTAFESPREKFAPVCDESDLNRGKLVGVELEGEAVVVARSEETGEVCAIAATCSHLGGPLDKGEREGDTVICPWHGSRFHLCSGDVEGGPAVYPQPRYEARVRAGRVEIRAAKG